MLEDSRDRPVQPRFAELEPVGLARADQLALLDELGEERRDAENARQSSRPRSDRTRKMRPSERTTRLSGSRNDPGSRSVAVPVCSST